MRCIIITFYFLIFTVMYCRTEFLQKENEYIDIARGDSENLRKRDLEGDAELENDLEQEDKDNDLFKVENQPGNTSKKSDILHKTDLHKFMEEAISGIETSVKNANIFETLPYDMEKDYKLAVFLVEGLINIIKDYSQADIFLKSKGIDRVIIPNVSVKYAKLRNAVLKLLKLLFVQLPTVTEADVPISAVDKLVDIFENDDDLGIKAHALDILRIWLPKNPKAQLRVIKMKGLEPFFNGIFNLSGDVISKLLELFNLILEEHIKERIDVKQIDSDTFSMYQSMGLLEQLTTLKVCNALIDIFQMTFSSSKYYDVTTSVYKLIENIKPFCTKVQMGEPKAIRFFKSLLEQVKSRDEADFERYGLNVKNIKMVLEDYVRKIENYPVKDEF